MHKVTMAVADGACLFGLQSEQTNKMSRMKTRINVLKKEKKLTMSDQSPQEPSWLSALSPIVSSRFLITDNAAKALGEI